MTKTAIPTGFYGPTRSSVFGWAYATSDRETIGVRRETNLRQPEQRLVRFARGTEAVRYPIRR